MPLNSTTAPQRTFWCFISYRHADNKDPGRQWASWLHHAIETYEVPSDLVGTTNERGDLIPERIYPVFRDEDELPVDADLASPIFRALDASKFLLVICSPRAVESNYVAQEISYFKQLGREERVLAAMIAGEPNASSDPTKKSLAMECFPEPLRHRVDEQGNLQKELAEPVAADFRLNDGSEGWCSPEAYRQDLKSTGNLSSAQIEQRVTNYQQRCDLMKLKIIAGVLGIPLGTLTQRDKAYQLELSRKRARRLRQWLAAVAVLGIFAIAGAVIARQQALIAQEKTIYAEQQAKIAQQQSQIAREQTVVAEQQRTVAQQQTTIATENLTLARARLAETFYKEASRLIQGPAGSTLPAVEALVSSLESAPDYGPSRRMLEHKMATSEWVVPLAKITINDDIDRTWLSESGEMALILSKSGLLLQFDLKQSKEISSVDLSQKLPRGAEIVSAACSPSQHQVSLLCQIQKPRTIAAEFGDIKYDWSWQLFVLLRDGTMVGTDPLEAINRDQYFRATTTIRADRLADHPLFYVNDRLLLMVHDTNIFGWDAATTPKSLSYLGAHQIPLVRNQNQNERIYGWEYDSTKQMLRMMTNLSVIHQSVFDGKIIQRLSYSNEADEMFPSPDAFSGMISFGPGTQAAVSGLVDASFQLPEGVGVGMPKRINEATEQYSTKYTSYSGVFQFNSSGGGMFFDQSLFQYFANNQEENDDNFSIAFNSQERVTEWPPFLMREYPTSILLLSTVQSGYAAPQLLEIIRKPKPDKERYNIPTHHGISQVLTGTTCWIAADGSKLAQIHDHDLIVYRTSWSASATTRVQTSSTVASRPLSFCANDLGDKKQPTASSSLTWNTSTTPASLKLNEKTFTIPENLTTKQVVADYTLESKKIRLIVFQDSKSLSNEDAVDIYDRLYRVWTLHLDSGKSELSEWIFSFSVDQRETLLATCDGVNIRISHLSDGKEIRVFSPQRLNNHMIAPAQSVFFSTDSQVLGVGSLISVQDVSIDHRAFDVETGSEYPLARSGLNIWHFDLFPQTKSYELQEWRDGPTPQKKRPFFLAGFERDFVNSLQARESEKAVKVQSSDDVSELREKWSILQWPDFAR